MSIIDSIYPVGYVYMTTDSAFDPNTYSPFDNTVWSSVNDSAANISVTASPGSYVGENFVTLTTAQMQSHNHTGNGVFTKPGNSVGTYGNTTINSIWNRINTVAGTSDYGYGKTTFYSSGGNQPHNNMQPYYQIYKWIRTE